MTTIVRVAHRDTRNSDSGRGSDGSPDLDLEEGGRSVTYAGPSADMPSERRAVPASMENGTQGGALEGSAGTSQITHSGPSQVPSEAREVARQEPSPAADGEWCYICLAGSEEEAELGALLGHACSCASTHVHTVCLEKLINSRTRRSLPVHVRLTCQVCAASYRVRVAATLQEPYVPYVHPVVACLTNSWKRYGFVVKFIALALVVMAMFIGISVNQWGLIVVQFLLLSLAVCSPCLCFGNVWLQRRRTQQQAQEPQHLDDEDFYNKVVRPTRARAMQKPASNQLVHSSRPQGVLLHVGIGDVGGGALREPPPQPLPATDAAQQRPLDFNIVVRPANAPDGDGEVPLIDPAAPAPPADVALVDGARPENVEGGASGSEDQEGTHPPSGGSQPTGPAPGGSSSTEEERISVPTDQEPSMEDVELAATQEPPTAQNPAAPGPAAQS